MSIRLTFPSPLHPAHWGGKCPNYTHLILLALHSRIAEFVPWCPLLLLFSRFLPFNGRSISLANYWGQVVYRVIDCSILYRLRIWWSFIHIRIFWRFSLSCWLSLKDFFHLVLLVLWLIWRQSDRLGLFFHPLNHLLGYEPWPFPFQSRQYLFHPTVTSSQTWFTALL